MDSKEAFAVLGLEAPTSAEAIRRAYLRSVRLHPPEHDAEGFQRVRAAYDSLRNAPWLWHPGLEEIVRETSASVEAPRERMADSASVLGELEALSFGEPLDMRPNEADGEADVPPPTWQVLDDALRLLEEGEPAEARRLVVALDERVSRLGTRATEIGAVVIARWTLVNELLALEGVASASLIAALAQGVRSGDFEEARRAYDRSRKQRGWGFSRAVMARTPSLRKMLVSEEVPSRACTGFTHWSWVWIGMVLVQAVVHFAGPTAARRPASSSLGARSGSTARGPTGQPASPGEQPTLPSLVEPLLVTVAHAIDEAVRLGDCNTVREQWPSYARETRGAPGSRDDYSVRRRQVLAMCSELDGELSEVP